MNEYECIVACVIVVVLGIVIYKHGWPWNR